MQPEGTVARGIALMPALLPQFRRSCYGSIGDRSSASPPPLAERLSQNAMDSHIHIWRQRSESFRSALQEALRFFHAKEGQTLQVSLPIQLLVQSQQVEPTDSCLARQILQTHCGREILAHEVFDLAQPAVARIAVVWLAVAAVPDQEMGGPHLSRSLSIKIWRGFLKRSAQTQHQLAHQRIGASEAARQDRGRGTFTPEFSCDAFDGRGRKMELQVAVCRVTPPSQCNGFSRGRHTKGTRLGMRGLPTLS